MRSRADTLLTPSPVTLGTSGLGHGADAAADAADVAAARALLTGGHTLIDTANMYGGGRSEVILGRAIAELGGVPAGVQVISKADRDLATGTFDRDRVLRSFEESTARLGLDTLPLYQLHDQYTITFAEAMGPGGAVQALVELREQGAVGAIGVAAGPTAMLADYVRTGVFEVLLTHNRYTLVDRSAAGLIAEAAERGMTVFNAAPFGGGLLAAGARPGATYAYRAAPDALLAWVTRLEELCAGFGVPVAAVALHFSARNPRVASTVVGVRSPERLAQTDALLATEVPEELWAEIDRLGTPPSTLDD
ncbi:aldo/keto reductase [Occultella glacieicola]|uniref:Aldo/keto reductase n=1 Tax=Occultella glacieicola TaxID=2518684 RepID=A0ABY2E533_9MICO|nr:aldo/keto reductase [Occultella glacieicola]TDE95133.1 aldo/keto reductase [Occultella glacieicola]